MSVYRQVIVCIQSSLYLHVGLYSTAHKHPCHRNALALHANDFVLEAFKICKKQVVLSLMASETLQVDPHKPNAWPALPRVCSASKMGMKKTPNHFVQLFIVFYF